MLEIPISFLSLDRIAESGQCFRWRKTSENAYVIPAHGRRLHVRQPAPDRLVADCPPEEWAQIWSPYFDMQSDYAAYEAAIDPSDEYLLAACGAARGVRILRQSLWETMISFIISQNNNIPRIQKCLLKLCGGEEAAFISPESLAERSESELRSLGLGYRAPYLKYAAERYLRDGLKDDFAFGSHGEARAYFCSYKGIGPKVSDCICLFALGQKDAFPMDVWVKRILARHYSGVFPLARYEGFAGVLQQWMFYYERLHG